MTTRDEFDGQAAYDVVLRHDAGARRREAMITLRRTLRDLCRQAIITNLTNLETFTVLTQLAPRGLFAVEDADALDAQWAALSAATSHNSDVMRLYALAADAFQDAANAVRASCSSAESAASVADPAPNELRGDHGLPAPAQRRAS